MNHFSLESKWELGKELNGNTPFKCFVAYPDVNRKKIDIPKEVFEEAFSSAVGIPVVAHFFSDGVMGGHSGDSVKTGYELRKTGKTYAYGVTRYDKMPYWETKDGVDWICMEGYIFTRRFPESKEILSSKQSMEVNLNFSDVNSDVKKVSKLEFLALCSLNAKYVEPVFEGSHFTAFSSEDYDEAYEKGDIEAYYKKMKELFNDDEFIMKPSEKIKYSKIDNIDDLKTWLELEGVEFSDEEISELKENFDFSVPEKYKNINFKPPASLAKQAKRGLELRDKQPSSNKCCTATGLARARQLINRQELSPSTVERMKSFFERHEVDKQGEGWGEDSKGYQAWLVWGGDAGYTWAKKIVAQMERADESEVSTDDFSSVNKNNTQEEFNKEAGVDMTKEEKDMQFSLSMNTIRAKLESVFRDTILVGDAWFYIRDFDQEYIYVSMDGGLCRYDYTATEESYTIDANSRKTVAEVSHYVVEGEEMKMAMDEEKPETKEDDDSEKPEEESEKEEEEDMSCGEKMDYAKEMETLKMQLAEKEAELMKYVLANKEMEFAKILDSEDFAMLTEEDKMSLKENKDMSVEDFTMKAEAMAYKRIKENGLMKVKEKEGFSIGIPHNDGGANEEPKTTLEKVKQYIGKQ